MLEKAGMSIARSQMRMSLSASGANDASDDELVAAFKSGHGWAGEAIVRRHHAGLLGYLTRLSGSSGNGEELVQQTWLSAFEHFDQFRPSESGGLKAWLYRIASNKAHDHWRSRGRERTALSGLRLVTDDQAPDASQPSDQAEMAEKLRQAIEQLPAPQREVVVMRYFGGLKFNEIADAVGCPLNTALGRMHKAMIKLKYLLDPEAP